MSGTLHVSTELRHILLNKELCTLFKQFLKESYCDENLLAWIDIQMYKNEDPDNYRSMAQELVQKYFCKDSPHEVNITGVTMKKLMKRMSIPTMRIFDGVEKEIFYLMATDSLPKFRQTPTFKQWRNSSEEVEPKKKKKFPMKKH